MADRDERVCDRRPYGEHVFAKRPGDVLQDGDECRCGAVKWSDVAQARAEPPPSLPQHDLDAQRTLGRATMRDVAIARGNGA